MAKLLATLCAFLSPAFACLASGWNDYILDIGDGYKIVRASSFEVCLDKGGPIHPEIFSGPLCRYITTPKYIFTMNRDISPLNRESYFVVTKGPDEVVGPLSSADFAKRPEVASLGPLDWKSPRNPNFWAPLLGSLLFLVLAIPILAIKFFWIVIPVVVAILVLRNVRRRRREAANGDPPT